MKELNPIIKAVAEAYNFNIVYHDDLEKWIVSYRSKIDRVDLYWSSAESYDDFFCNLKAAFMDAGYLPYI